MRMNRDQREVKSGVMPPHSKAPPALSGSRAAALECGAPAPLFAKALMCANIYDAPYSFAPVSFGIFTALKQK
jgi:hypothetical protein